ncbi:MAG: PQQ-binding-like beta-propeller repeat protein [ANME-2 cluster archaeon]|jgi:outer membrane protein assembly factor BamB|nr:MAG: PQQ-binding-like beta-propeller repeat protein [ANME-2 cluster archaeon]
MNTKTILMLTIVMITLTGTAIASDWQQFQKNETNNGLTGGPAPRSDPELVWSAFTRTDELGNGIDVPPIIAGDLVYVYDADGTLWAFNKTDGTLIWRNETSVGFQSSTPAYGNGNIFVASNIGDMYAFDAATGEQLWKEHVTDRNFECPVTYHDHRIYAGEGLSGGVTTKYYYCYGENGNELWKHATDNTAGFLWCGASVVENYLVYPVHEGRLISVYLENGTLRDEIDLKSGLSFSRSDLGRIRVSVSYHDRYVYTTSEKSQATGYVWKVGFEDGRFVDRGWSSLIGFSTSTPVIHDGRVYVGQGGHEHPSGNLTCLNDSNGELIWKYAVPKGVKSSPALSTSNDGVYIHFTTAVSGGSLYCLRDCGDSAALAWEYNPPDDGYILQGAAISDGLVYFGTGGGYVYCIGRRGDLNHDGVVTAADALIALGMAVGAVPAALVGDMNRDGAVTSLDALLIMQAVAVGRSRI